MKPYGEVFLAYDNIFVVSCTYCDPGSNRLIAYNEFLNHVLEIHSEDPLSTYNFALEDDNYSQHEFLDDIIDEQQTNDVKVEKITIEIDTARIFKSDLEEERLDQTQKTAQCAIKEIENYYEALTETSGEYHCLICDRYYNFENYEEHRLQNTCGTCTVCNTQIDDLYKHIRNHHKDYYEEKMETSEKTKLNDPEMNSDINTNDSKKSERKSPKTSKSLLENENLNKSQIKARYTHKEIENYHDDLTEKNVKYHCNVCDRYYNFEKFEKHRVRKACGTCPVCNTQCADLYKHIRNHHKDYYEQRMETLEKIKLRNSTSEINFNNNTIDTNEPKHKRTFKTLLEEDYIKVSSIETQYKNQQMLENNYKDMTENIIEYHCDVCDRYYSFEKFEKHIVRKSCGTCPVCNTQMADLYKHIRNNHKDYYAQRMETLEKIKLRNPTEMNLNTEKCAIETQKNVRTFTKIFSFLGKDNLKDSRNQTENQNKETDYENLTENNVEYHCVVCDRYYNFEQFEKHRVRKSCGTCPVCNIQIVDLYSHIRNIHKDYYEQKKKDYKKKAILNTTSEFISNNTTIIETKKNVEITSGDNDIADIKCLYCGQHFSANKFESHQAQRKCGKCPVCLSIVTNVFRHVSTDHKEYVEERKRLKENTIRRLPLSENEYSLKKFKGATLEEKEQNLIQQDESIVQLNDITSSHKNNKLEKEEVKNIFLCPYCDRTFKYKYNYDKHIEKHETKADTCNFCGKRFKTLCRLKKHLRLHTGERPYKCEICSLTFNESNNLKAHFVNRHTEGLHLKCTYENCNKVFKTNRRRTFHEAYAHSDKYNNLCKECGIIFKTSGFLNSHTKRKHVKYEDREFSCKFCKKKFAFKYELIPHEMMHLGQKRHQCELCSKGFIARRSFKRHCRIVHGKELDEIIIKSEK